MNERAVLAGPNFSAQFKSACDEKGFYSKFESFYCRRVMSRLLSFSSGCPKSIRLLTTISSPFFTFQFPPGLRWTCGARASVRTRCRSSGRSLGERRGTASSGATPCATTRGRSVTVSLRERRQCLNLASIFCRDRERLVVGWLVALGCQRTAVAQFLLANGWQMVAIGSLSLSPPLWIVCRRRFSRKQLMASILRRRGRFVCAKNRIVGERQRYPFHDPQPFLLRRRVLGTDRHRGDGGRVRRAQGPRDVQQLQRGRGGLHEGGRRRGRRRRPRFLHDGRRR